RKRGVTPYERDVLRIPLPGAPPTPRSGWVRRARGREKKWKMENEERRKSREHKERKGTKKEKDRNNKPRVASHQKTCAGVFPRAAPWTSLPTLEPFANASEDSGRRAEARQ